MSRYAFWTFKFGTYFYVFVLTILVNGATQRDELLGAGRTRRGLARNGSITSHFINKMFIFFT